MTPTGEDAAKNGPRWEAAERVIRKGVAAAVTAGLLHLGVVLVGILSGPSVYLAPWSDPWSILDAMLILGLAYGLHRRSRVAAVCLILLVLGSRVLYWAETGNLGGMSVTLVFLYFFARAAWGAFQFHRIRPRSAAPPPSRPRWPYWLAVPAGLLVAGLLAVGGLVEFGVIPDSAVVPGDRLPSRTRAALGDHDLLLPGENVLYFYSDGTFSILEDGNFFTEERVVSYERSAGGLWQESAPFEEIESIEADFGSGMLDRSTIRVATRDGREFLLLVSPQGNGDKEFVQRMRKQWRKRLEAVAGSASPDPAPRRERAR